LQTVAQFGRQSTYLDQLSGDHCMNIAKQFKRISVWAAFAIAALSGCAGMSGNSVNLYLNGANEVPPVSTAATGNGTITVGADMAVSGSVTTTGVAGTAAHIHIGAAGANGPVIVPLTKSGDNMWVVPPDAKLKEDQYQAFKAGGLYVNVHSAANKGGEIRDQLRP
jgi:hypothetical protein